MTDKRCDIAIIGAGIVGLAAGLHLVRRHPGTRVVVLDKEDRIVSHQTGHNSGVIHSGTYYKPGSLKARLCVEGSAAMVRFCREYSIPHEVCGKIIVATRPSELAPLAELQCRGTANGVPGLRELDPAQIREIEPNVAGIRAIHVPGAGITDFRMVAEKYAALIHNSGSEVLPGYGVRRIAHDRDGLVLETLRGAVRARFAVNCAGLQSDLVAAMAGARLGLRIVPFRGEFYNLAQEKVGLVKGLIYPVPDSRYPFLGVHFIRRISGSLEGGPNAVLAFKREGYARTDFNLRDTLSTMLFPGFWKMASRYWKTGLWEIYRSWNKRAFTAALQRLVPALTGHDLLPGGSGVRAQALDDSGNLLDDFSFLWHDRILHVGNVPSPAATASLVIGREIVTRLEQHAGLPKIPHRGA